MSLLRRIEKGNKPGATGGETGGESGLTPDNEEQSKLAQMRVRQRTAATGAQAARDSYLDIKTRVQTKLLSELDPTVDTNSQQVEIRATMEELYTTILAEENIVLSRAERNRLFEGIVAEILGLGPLDPLLADDTVTEIMVNGPKNVYIERKGRIERTTVSFENEDHVLRILERIVAPLGRRIDESQPYVDARLKDGSRVNAVIRPISLIGPTITIRKFSRDPLTVDDLIRFGSVTQGLVEFMRSCVIARLNIIVSGGTGSGKTTLLNVLSSFIPDDERIVTVENAAELQLRQDHVVTLESRPPNIEGKGEITIEDLVVNCLRMRPDRIIVGECRSGEALDMLQAMNTGHDGSLTTLHSNSPRDTIARLETMCLMKGMNLPVKAIREQIASAVDLICHEERMRDGTRKVTKITEVQGMEGDTVVLSDIFEFEQTGIEAGKVIGRIRPTGLRPKFVDKLEAAGIHLPPSVFGVGQRL